MSQDFIYKKKRSILKKIFLFFLFLFIAFLFISSYIILREAIRTKNFTQLKDNLKENISSILSDLKLIGIRISNIIHHVKNDPSSVIDDNTYNINNSLNSLNTSYILQ